MEISFKSDGEVQIVEMVGALGDGEAAAVRFKLEEKINGGKSKIVLDLAQYATTNDAARTALFGIINYVLARHALIVASGLPLAQWPLMVLPDGRQIKNFLTRAEALVFTHSTSAPDPRAHLKTKTSTNDEEAKGQALAKLLGQYDVFQHGVDVDPFRLEFLALQYKNSPNREALNIEGRVREAIAQIQLENASLNHECEVLAAELKQLILYRKSPLDPKEFSLKENSLTAEVARNTANLDQVQTELDDLAKKISAVLEETVASSRDLEQNIEDLNKRLAKMQGQIEVEEKSLKTRDAEEQRDFEAQLKSKQ